MKLVLSKLVPCDTAQLRAKIAALPRQSVSPFDVVQDLLMFGFAAVVSMLMFRMPM